MHGGFFPFETPLVEPLESLRCLCFQEGVSAKGASLMARPSVSLLLLAALGLSLRPCWVEVGVLPRRNALGAVGLTLMQPVVALAEETSYKTQTPTGDPYLQVVESPTRDFVIQLPANWQKEFDTYPGRLILSVDPAEFAKLQANKPNEVVTVRCARLTLPALLRSAQFMPRPGDEQRSDWKEVALGEVTGANIAEWIMRAGQQTLATQMGMQLPQIDIDVVDVQITAGAKPDQSVLTWHATNQVKASSVKPIGQESDEVQGLGGKSLMPLSEAMTAAPPVEEARDVPKLAAFGQAILSKGSVTFAVIQSPANRLDPTYTGPTGKQYLDYIVQSLKLTPSSGTF